MKWFLKFILFLYLLICLIAYLIQGKIILYPHQVPDSTSYRIGQEVEIPIDDNLSMNCLHIDKGSDKVVLYFHGNKGNIGRAIYQTRSVHGQDIDVFIPDYRGYGKTEGSLWSDNQLLDDADKAYQYLKQNYEESQIVVMGYSLGSGMASYVASIHKPSHLILVAPFTSLSDIKDDYVPFLPDFLMRFDLPNIEFIESVTCPISIVHGTKDNVVRYKFSKALKEKFGDKVKLITSEGQNHRGIIFDRLLTEELDRVFN